MLGVVKSPSLRWLCLVCCSWLCYGQSQPTAIQHWWQQLKSTDPVRRAQAASALGDAQLTSSDDLLQLVRALADENPVVRAEAVVAVGKQAGSDAMMLVHSLNLIEAMTGTGDNRANEVADQLAIALAAGGPSVVAPILREYQGFSRPASDRRIQYLFSYLGKEATHPLEIALTSNEPALQERAVRALMIVGSRASISFH